MKKAQTVPRRLAIHGGTPVMKKPLREPHNISTVEAKAANVVIRRGPLSGFLGAAGSRFFGGREVQALEREFKRIFKTKHAVAFNSATTALHGAMVALGIGPGDEVIVPPFTMSATAACVVQNGAVPIFADIDPETCCIDPVSVAERITPRTKAVIAVNLFGQPADFDALIPLCKKKGIALVEDNAQAPLATWRGRYAGTLGDIGVFSFNVHKAMQSGEGGMLVTGDARLALRAQLCRNHGESVVAGLDTPDIGPLVGSNYRMAEVVAAIARVQLNRVRSLTKHRVALARRLTKGLKGIPGIRPPVVREDCTHVYYRFLLHIDEARLGIRRDVLADAMTAEGFPLSKGYVKPLYLLPLFQQKKAFNGTDFPFGKSTYYDGNPEYAPGICPVVERLHGGELALTDITQYPYTSRHVDLFLAALKKVLAHRDELRS